MAMNPIHPEPGTKLIPVEPQTLDMPAPVVGYPSAVVGGAGPSMTDYLRMLKKHKWIILFSTVFVLVVVTVASFRMVPQYEAAARIAISRESDDALRLNEQQGSSDFRFDYNVELDTQAKIMQSDTLALAVIERLELDKNPRFAGGILERGADLSPADREAQLLNRWRDSLTVNKIQRTRMIEIRFLNPDAKLAAQIVNTLANAYVENNYRTRYESTMQASEWLQNQLNDLQVKVQASQEALVKYQRENNIVGLDEKQNTTVSKLEDLNKQATEAQTDRVLKEASYQQTIAGNIDAIPELSSNGLIQDLRRQEADLKRQLAQAQTQFGDSYPRVKELKNQVADIQATIKAEIDRIVQRKGAEYRAALSRERMLLAALNAQKSEVNQLNEKAIRYFDLKREAETTRQLYEGLLAKLKEAAVTSGLRSSNVRVVDVARPPAKPAKPNIPRNIALGFLLGLIGGISLAFILEALDNTVRTPDQVESLVGLPALGIIPLSLADASRKNGSKDKSTSLVAQADARDLNKVSLMVHTRPKSEVAESYRALRTSILLSAIGGAPRIILMTSALPQDGKTTTSTNTAIALTQKGGRVLLVDADMRRPAVHSSFRMRNRNGLSTVLTGSQTLEEAVQVSPIMPNLFVLPAGPPPPHPAELLGSQVMKQFIARWRQEYEHVIIDTPPVLSVTDAVLLSVEADAVVLVIRSGRTTKEAMRRSRELLAQVNARVMGVVVNAMDLHSPDAYYYYYGAQYGGRYYDETAEQSKKQQG
jgi:succinoglycan biosynthesis transport protein ExoP